MTQHPLKPASWGELLSGRNGLRSLAVAGGVALHAVNVYIATTILPSVVRDIGGLEYYAWNMTLFVAASIMASALSAKAFDVLGLKRAFLLAITIFSASTLLCALAPTMGWMLFGRTAQGLGGGLLLGLCYSSIRVVFEARLWTRAMGLVSSMWGVATLAGPAIGGIFAQSGHWRWAFGAILPVAAALAWLVMREINESTVSNTDAPRQKVSVPVGKVALIVLSVLIVSSGSLSTAAHWNALGIIAGLAVALYVAQLDQRPATQRWLPDGAYSVRQPMGSIYACVGLMSTGITVEIFIPYFLQTIHGFEPLPAGYLTALMSLGWTTGSISSSGREAATARRLMRCGPVVSTVSLLGLFLLLPVAGIIETAWKWPLSIFMMGVGLGIGICWPHLLAQVFRSAPSGQESIASSAMITIQLYALALGSALAGMIVNAAGMTDPGGVEGAVSASRALFVLFALAPGAAVFIMGRVVSAKLKTDRKVHEKIV